MITPIPKAATKDKRIPLNYRGISLLSVVSKLYSAVLNNILLNYLDGEHLLAEMQNGFRRNPSYEDHVYSACTLIRNRLLSKRMHLESLLTSKKLLTLLTGMYC